MALTRKVILEYTIDAKGAKKGAAEIDKSLNKTKKSASGFSKAVSAIGPQIAAAFTVGAIINFGKQAVKTFATFQKSLASLQGILGVTTQELKFFSDAALELAKTSTRSASEIVKAFELVGSAKPELLKNSEALKLVTEQVIILSEASGLDLVQSTDALTGSLNQFGVGAEEAATFMNALAAGAQAGAAAIPLVSQTIRVAGTVASDAGLSFEQLVGLTETLAEKSLTGAEAGTNLRNILLKLQVAGIGFSSGVFDINDALDELAAKNLSAEEATKLFGLESITAGNILIANRERFKELTEAVTGTNTAVEQAALNNATYEATMKRLENAIDIIFIQIGEKLAPIIGTLAEKLTEAANSTDELKEEFDGIGELIGIVVDGTSALLGLFGDLEVSFTDILKVMNPLLFHFEKLGDDIRELRGAITFFNRETSQAAIETENLGDETSKTNKELTGLAAVLAKVNKGVLDVKEETKAATPEVKKLKEEFKEIETNNTINTLKVTGEGLNTIGDNAERAALDVGDLDAAMDKLAEREQLDSLTGKFGQLNDALTFTSQILDIVDDVFEASFNNELSRLEAEKEARIKAAGDSSSEILKINKEFGDKEDKLRKKQGEQFKAKAIAKAIINTALAVVQALLQPPVPNLVQGALALAAGLAQVAIISSQKFADGGINIDGPGTSTSDSINARLSKGESVITAHRTRQFLPTLEAIHTGRISPDLMNAFVNSGGNFAINNNSSFNDSGMIGATKDQTRQLIRALNKNTQVNSGNGYFSNKKRLINE